MSAAIASATLVVLFAGATLLADTLAARQRPLPILALGLLLFAAFVELARYDHGMTQSLFWIGWVGAPLVAIFGGASFGTRRFYGWPDLGPHPSRAAFVAAAILLGVFVGIRMQASDVERSQRVAERLARDVRTWQTVHGTLPRELAQVVTPVPVSHMGLAAPPPFRLGTSEAGSPVIAFPVGGTAWMTLDIASEVWVRRRAAPRPVPEATAP